MPGGGAERETDRRPEQAVTAAASAGGSCRWPPTPGKRRSPSGGHRGRPRVLNGWCVTHGRQRPDVVEEPEIDRREHRMVPCGPVLLPTPPLAHPNPPSPPEEPPFPSPP